MNNDGNNSLESRWHFINTSLTTDHETNDKTREATVIAVAVGLLLIYFIHAFLPFDQLKSCASLARSLLFPYQRCNWNTLRTYPDLISGSIGYCSGEYLGISHTGLRLSSNEHRLNCDKLLSYSNKTDNLWRNCLWLCDSSSYQLFICHNYISRKKMLHVCLANIISPK